MLGRVHPGTELGLPAAVTVLQVLAAVPAANRAQRAERLPVGDRRRTVIGQSPSGRPVSPTGSYSPLAGPPSVRCESRWEVGRLSSCGCVRRVHQFIVDRIREVCAAELSGSVSGPVATAESRFRCVS